MTSDNSGFNQHRDGFEIGFDDDAIRTHSQAPTGGFDNPLFQLLQMITAHKIPIFHFNPYGRWNLRAPLGNGAVARVEESSLVHSQERVMQVNYRSPGDTNGGSHFSITGYGGEKWLADTQFAFRVANLQLDTIDPIAEALLNDLEVWCQPASQQHPNISRLLGVAWMHEDHIYMEDRLQRNTIRDLPEIPVAIIERADHGD